MMNDQGNYGFLWRIRRIFLLIMLLGIYSKFSPPQSIHAMPPCEQEIAIAINKSVVYPENTKTTCLQVSIPAGTAQVILTHSAGSSDYEIYWDDEFQDSKSDPLTTRLTYEHQASIKNYISNFQDDIIHTIKFVPLLPESKVPKKLTVYAKGPTGKLLTTVGETSGSGNSSGNPIFDRTGLIFYNKIQTVSLIQNLPYPLKPDVER